MTELEAGDVPPRVEAGSLAPADVPVKRGPSRQRVLWIATAAVAVLAVVAVGVVVLIPGRSGNSAVTMAHCQPASLETCLIAAPAGAVRLSSTGAWAPVAAPSAALYASNVVDGDAPSLNGDVALQLNLDGLHNVVHTDWNAADGDVIDLVVLQFDTQKGARAWGRCRRRLCLGAATARTAARAVRARAGCP